MLSWAAPLWLFGLALLPLIRWLHRGGRNRRALPVSRLELWRGSAASPSTAGKDQPPDPAWRRRALLAALLFIALAQPQWPERRPSITLWVDDSLSMLTREPPQETRLVAALAQARAQLAQVEHGDLAVRTLSDPWRDLGPLTDAVVAMLAAGAGQSEPAAPPTALLHSDRLHWLLTDGADLKPLSWPEDTRPDRIIQVANVTGNVGLERLSARRSPDQPERIDLLLKLTNGGAAIETRELVIATEAGEVGRSRHRLDPGTSAIASLSIPASASVRATLQPADALTEDDGIALQLTTLRKRSVDIDPRCPAALVAAVSAHPALTVAPETATDVDAVLDCGSRAAAQGVMTLRVISTQTPMPVPGPLKWSSTLHASNHILLDAGRLLVAARLQARPADVVLLAAADRPLIIARAGASKLIETSLDFGSMANHAGPEVPLLVNLMFEQLFGGILLDQIAIIDRGPGASRVAPHAGIELRAGARRTTRVPILHDGAWPLVVAALLVLLWEIVALARQTRRVSEFPGGSAA